VIKLWAINYKRGADQIRRVFSHDFIRSFTGHTDWVLESKISPDSRVVASVCTKSVRLWDINTGSEIVKFKHVGLLNTCVAIHPDGNYVAVGSGSKHVKIWDMRAQKLAQDYLLPTGVNGIDFHPSGVVLASAQDYQPGTSGSSLNLFDIRQSRCIFELEGLHDTLNTVSFSQDGEYMTAGGNNRLVYVWKTNLDLKRPAEVAKEEFLAKADNEIDIGGAISLEKHMEAYAERDKNEVHQQISTSLENIVLKINSISESLWGLDARLKESERKTNHLFKIVQIREHVALGHTKISDQSYKTNFGGNSAKTLEHDFNALLDESPSERKDYSIRNEPVDFNYTHTGGLPDANTIQTRDLVNGLTDKDRQMPTVYNDSDNPFRGRQLLLDSVKSRDSDYPQRRVDPGEGREYRPDIDVQEYQEENDNPYPLEGEDDNPLDERISPQDNDEKEEEEYEPGIQVETREQRIEISPRPNQEEEEDEEDRPLEIETNKQEVQFGQFNMPAEGFPPVEQMPDQPMEEMEELDEPEPDL
jgi:hypothetical protein